MDNIYRIVRPTQQEEHLMDVLDVTDRMAELSRAVTGLSSLLYGNDPIPASGGELASLLMLLQREVEAIGEVVSHIGPIRTQ